MSKQIYFAAKAIIINNNNFLVLHKSNSTKPLFELPGGRMKYGENAEQTLTREVYEETNLNVEPIRLLDTWNVVGNDFQITGVIYLCNIESGE